MTELQSTLEKQSSELSVLQRRLLEAEEALRAAQRDAQRSQELQARLQRDLHEKSAQNQDQVCLFAAIFHMLKTVVSHLVLIILRRSA